MKNLLTTLTLAAALVGCASNQDPMGPMTRASTKKETQAVRETQECVSLKGTFTRVGGGFLSDISLKTEVTDGVTRYSFDGGDHFIVADGQEQPALGGVNEKGVVIATCDSSSVTIKLAIEGKPAEQIVYSLVSEKRVNIKGDGEQGKLLAGDYDRKEEGSKNTPTPVVVECPTLEGTYERVDGKSSASLSLSTKVENGVYSYSFDGGESFEVADGQPRIVDLDAQKITSVLTCSAGNVTESMTTEGQEPVVSSYTVTGEGQLKLEANGSRSLLNGNYVKK